MKFCLNVEELFQDMEIYDKIKAAHDAGYDYIEFWSWCDRDVERIKAECEKYGVQITGFKGDWDWSLVDSATRDEFIGWTKKSIETAKYLNCDSIIVHSNSIFEDGAADFNGVYTPERQIANITATLMKAAPILEAGGVKMYIEPLNCINHLAGMFLADVEVTADIVRAVGSPNIRLLCDIFQNQRRHGDVTAHMLKNLDIMDYVHVADSPDRGEPGTGELNYKFILKTLKENGFDGVAALELTPIGTDAEVIAAYDEVVAAVK